jgi:hypothetical protein
MWADKPHAESALRRGRVLVISLEGYECKRRNRIRGVTDIGSR